MLTAKIYFVRHAESTGNKNRTVQGHADTTLTHKGEQEAELAGKWLANKVDNFDYIVSSSLQRCTRTASIIRDCVHGNKQTLAVPIETSYDWRQGYRGKVEGVPYHEVRNFITRNNLTMAETVEPRQEITRRVDKAFTELLSTLQHKFCHSNKTVNVLVVSHSKVIPQLFTRWSACGKLQLKCPVYKSTTNTAISLMDVTFSDDNNDPKLELVYSASTDHFRSVF